MARLRCDIRPASQIPPEPCSTASFVDENKSTAIQFLSSKLRFAVPLRHEDPDGESITLVGRMVYAQCCPGTPLIDWEDQIRMASGMPDQLGPLRDRPILLYLCGGPGADNPFDRVPDLNRCLLRLGYQILYMDYRGCGESDPVSQKSLEAKGLKADQAKADYLKLFGQVDIVRDLEAVRLCLAQKLYSAGRRPEPDGLRWTILGQSYGGYISLTYLSVYPEGLQEVFITGGLPPCGMLIDDYFRIKHGKLVKETQRYFSVYPDDDRLLREVLMLIASIGPENIRMTGRGYMTGQKLLSLGRQFGSRSGFDEVHSLLCRIKSELGTDGQLKPETIRLFESTLHMDERPLYALLLEQTWCSGGATRWSAERIWRDLEGYEYLQKDAQGRYRDPASFPVDQPIYFTSHVFGEFTYDTHEELLDLKGVADILHNYEWECPYDYDRLAKNRVPVYALSFASDMHLDISVARKTAHMVGNLYFEMDDMHWHQALRHIPVTIMCWLFEMKKYAEERRLREPQEEEGR